MALTLKQILYQALIRSKPIRENFADVENAINDLQTQIDNLATPPAGTEVTLARDNHSALRDRLRSDSKSSGNVLISGGEVTEQVVPDMTVHIAAGEAIVDGVACKWAAQDSGTITAPAGNTRLDYVVVNSDNSISIITGTADPSPIFPTVAASQLVVAALVVKAATTSMNEGSEIFSISNGGDLYYPNVYVNAATTLTSNLNYNNLIVDGVKFDTASYAALCQGNAHLVSVNNANTAVGAVLSHSANMAYDDSSNYTIENYGGDGLSAGSVGKTGGYPVYKSPSGVIGFALKIKAFNIYLWGTISLSGANGSLGSADNGMFAQADSGYDGGNGATGGPLYLEAINEIVNSGTVNGNGANGGAGRACSAGTNVNLGGKGGDAGSGSTVTMKYKTATVGTVNISAGSVGAGGIGSGGATANGNGSAGAVGSAGVNTQTVWDTYTARPTDYADWIRGSLAIR